MFFAHLCSILQDSTDNASRGLSAIAELLVFSVAVLTQYRSTLSWRRDRQTDTDQDHATVSFNCVFRRGFVWVKYALLIRRGVKDKGGTAATKPMSIAFVFCETYRVGTGTGLFYPPRCNANNAQWIWCVVKRCYITVSGVFFIPTTTELIVIVRNSTVVTPDTRSKFTYWFFETATPDVVRHIAWCLRCCYLLCCNNLCRRQCSAVGRTETPRSRRRKCWIWRETPSLVWNIFDSSSVSATSYIVLFGPVQLLWGCCYVHVVVDKYCRFSVYTTTCTMHDDV